MFHREVWAFLCLSAGLLVGAIYVGLPNRLVPLAANEPSVSSDDATVSETVIAGMRRFAQSAAGLVRREPSPEVATAALPTATLTTSTTPAASENAVSAPTQTATYNVPLTTLKPADGNAGAAMTRDIQAELFRHGCYRGPMDGRWSASVKSAVGAFNARANAVLPMDGPDFALLSLARSLATPVCMGQVATAAPAPVAPAIAVEPPVTASAAAGSNAASGATPSADNGSAEVTTVRLRAQPADPVPGAIATAPSPANTRMSLGGQVPYTAEPAAPVTTAVEAAATAAPPAVAKDIDLFLHPLGQ